MVEGFRDRLEHAWNVFRGRDNKEPKMPQGGQISYGHRPDRTRTPLYTYGRVITPILNQIAVDAAGVSMRHVEVNDKGEYIADKKSGLSHTLDVWPNLDQAPTMFRQDIIMTMLEEGVVAVVPVETSDDPEVNGGFDIHQLRTGAIKSWMAQHVRVEVYNEKLGISQELILRKQEIAIIENPLYAIMNEPNSTLQRLIHKLGQLDITDDRLAAGKLDIILQLPYTIKHDSRLKEARQRVSDIEDQLSDTRMGIGYIDSTERITQLNRPSENNLLEQVKNLEGRVYSQMGLTEEIFFGTADEAAMLNYHNRTVFPIVRAIQEEFRRKFLTKTAMSRGQSIQFFRDPFSLVPVNQMAEIADKFTRNEIMSPNEFRPKVGLARVDDPKADELRNRNMPQADTEPEKERPENDDNDKENTPPRREQTE